MSSATVLYDAPGPRTIKRYRMYSAVSIAVFALVAAFVVWRFYETGQFSGKKWSIFQYTVVQETLLRALLNTLRAAGVAAVLALVFGAVFAAARISDRAWVRGPATFVVELFRAVPLLILMFFLYYGPPQFGVQVSPFTAVVVALMLYNGSVLAEILRAGILAVPKGQREAAYAIGLRKTQVVRIVLLPQAIRAMLPAIISQMVVLLKDTSLGFIITYRELLAEARQLASAQAFEFPTIPVAIVVTAIYVAMCTLLSILATRLERRSGRAKPGKDDGGGPTTAAEGQTTQPPAMSLPANTGE